MDPTVFSQTSLMFISVFINTDAIFLQIVGKHVAIYNNMITTGIVTKYSNENVLKSIYKEKLFHILYSGHTKHVN